MTLNAEPGKPMHLLIGLIRQLETTMPVTLRGPRTLVHIPMWIYLGAEDPAVNPLYGLAMFEALTNAGAHPGFTQYPEVGHFSWLGAYSDPLMMEWLFRQHK